ncbi:MAG: Uncharacterized protein FD155_1818 [Bacteroidetes bacterium]|nr:MAG: Uncharacterized protein FD155_1818 [Bacteroidota bacterium]
MKTHWKKQFNYNFLGTYSLPEEKDLVVTVARTENQQVNSANGKVEECLVVFFHEFDKPMILNRTNARTIEKLAATPFIEDWPGTRVQLYVARDVKAFNTTTDALRIRDFHPKPQDLDTEPIITGINQCNTLTELLKLYFALPKDLRDNDEVILAKNLRKEALSNPDEDPTPTSIPSAGPDRQSMPTKPVKSKTIHLNPKPQKRQPPKPKD